MAYKDGRSNFEKIEGWGLGISEKLGDSATKNESIEMTLMYD